MAGTAKKNVRWPDGTEYVDSYTLPSLKPTRPDPWTPADSLKTDMLQVRPRTPNDPYTVLTELQLKNMKKDSSPFFMKEANEPEPGSRKGEVIYPAPIDRYATCTSQYLFRDNPPFSLPVCWVGDQWQREPPAEYNTCRQGASLRWGPSKTGQRTIRHFHTEDVHRYLNIDMYKRPPTNIPAQVVMKHGRPSEGYYHQKNPNFNTWFGSTHRLNETNVLTTIRPKTLAEYGQIKAMEQAYGEHQASKWPEVSEYTHKYLLEKKPEKSIEPIEARKFREQRRLAAEAALRSQAGAIQATQAQAPAVTAQAEKQALPA
ncbi:hypothetical protein PoB_004849900 [Plakobranchus ocellatus]|uniref:Uncharacterized protein n=1 Tax=Plakobranchus ocellatus TaxID=259542 RepID=A0AAV4BPF8_9GAST|nr:hypothetical protein PoB_004849900 [Plakobranchus ocellatus]